MTNTENAKPTSSSSSSPTPPPPAGTGFNSPVATRTPTAQGRRSELITEHGRTSIADNVVAKIAGLGTREVSGVHDMGTGGARTFGAIKDRLGASQPSATQGVGVEVGERQVAVDLDIVVEYGAAIVDVAESVRRNVIQKVESMTGLEVTEVNITVDDVYLGGNDRNNEPEPEPRVR